MTYFKIGCHSSKWDKPDKKSSYQGFCFYFATSSSDQRYTGRFVLPVANVKNYFGGNSEIEKSLF